MLPSIWLGRYLAWFLLLCTVWQIIPSLRALFSYKGCARARDYAAFLHRGTLINLYIIARILLRSVNIHRNCAVLISLLVNCCVPLGTRKLDAVQVGFSRCVAQRTLARLRYCEQSRYYKCTSQAATYVHRTHNGLHMHPVQAVAHVHLTCTPCTVQITVR